MCPDVAATGGFLKVVLVLMVIGVNCENLICGCLLDSSMAGDFAAVHKRTRKLRIPDLRS